MSANWLEIAGDVATVQVSGALMNRHGSIVAPNALFLVPMLFRGGEWLIDYARTPGGHELAMVPPSLRVVLSEAVAREVERRAVQVEGEK